MNTVLRTPSTGNQYRMFLLSQNGEAIMLDLKHESERRTYERQCTDERTKILGGLGCGSKAMAIFDSKGVLVFGKLDPTVEKTFASWMQIS